MIRTIDDLGLAIKDASFPHPFAHMLEYNPPVHETWNIVHIGMQVPESIQVYICAQNCMRGVIMTAYEMGAEDRFACVCLEEEDILKGNMEEQIIDGVRAAIEEQKSRPRVVIVFPVCIHKILSTDLKYVYKRLRTMYPDIVFCEGFMDPLSQKEGIAPDVRLRYSMYNGVMPLKQDDGVNILGSETYFGDGADFSELLADHPVRQLTGASYQDYLDLGKSRLSITAFPGGHAAIKKLAQRLHQAFIYLPMIYDYDIINQQSALLCHSISDDALRKAQAKCEDALRKLKDQIGNTEIVIDIIAIPEALSLAKFLLAHGFRVTEIYLDDLLEEEADDFAYLKKHYPSLRLMPTIQPGMRFFHESGAVLAIGPKAAFFRDTVHFVNIIEGGGLWGYKGIMRLCELMSEAMTISRNPRDYVSRKGLGCDCLL